MENVVHNTLQWLLVPECGLLLHRSLLVGSFDTSVWIVLYRTTSSDLLPYLLLLYPQSSSFVTSGEILILSKVIFKSGIIVELSGNIVQYLNKFESTQTFSLWHFNYACGNIAYLHRNTDIRLGVGERGIYICIDNGFP